MLSKYDKIIRYPIPTKEDILRCSGKDLPHPGRFPGTNEPPEEIVRFLRGPSFEEMFEWNTKTNPRGIFYCNKCGSYAMMQFIERLCVKCGGSIRTEKQVKKAYKELVMNQEDFPSLVDNPKMPRKSKSNSTSIILEEFANNDLEKEKVFRDELLTATTNVENVKLLQDIMTKLEITDICISERMVVSDIRLLLYIINTKIKQSKMVRLFSFEKKYLKKLKSTHGMNNE